ARRQQGRLIDQVLQVRARKARAAAGQLFQRHVLADRDFAHVDPQDAFAALHIGTRNHDPAVEAAGPQQGRIEHVGTVGGRDQDYSLVSLEPVPLDQQLVERLFALVVATTQAGPAMAPDGVNFIYEYDAWGVLLALHKKVAHARGAHTHEHLDEVRARD